MKRKIQTPLEDDHPRKLKLPEREDTTVLKFPDSDSEESKVSQNLIIPWMSEETKLIRDPMLRLHSEIIEFTNYLAPTAQDHKIRRKAFEDVKQRIQEGMGEQDISIEIFGSFHTKTYLPNADIDLVAITQGVNDRKTYERIESILLNNPDTFSEVNYIRSAKVPIIKFIYTKNNIHFDVSVNKFDGISQLKEVQQALVTYPEMRYLIFINKCLLKQRELSETYTGGIGSFLLFSMILCFLRECRKSKVNYLLSDYLLMFMEFYGLRSWGDKRVFMKKHQIAERDPDGVEFSLMSPQDQSHDIGAGAYKIRDVFSVYKNRFRLMTNYNFKSGESILKHLVNPNEQIFCFLKQ